MDWLKEAEHMRDYGHTWGSGMDDRKEPTEEEIEQHKIWWKEFREKKARVRIEPSADIKKAAETLKASLPDSHAISSNLAPYNWREIYADEKLKLAKKAAWNLGYELVLKNWDDVDRNKFRISIEYYGYIPDRAGSIHHYDVRNVSNKEDCLQLFADFAEIGYWPTVWYRDYHIQLHDSADLRLEMLRWGFPLEEKKFNMDTKIQSAKERVISGHTAPDKKREEPAL